MRSMKVEAPSVVASNRTVVVVRKARRTGGEVQGHVVRRRRDSRSARSRASSRVRFLPGTGGLLDGAQVGASRHPCTGSGARAGTRGRLRAPRRSRGWQDGPRDRHDEDPRRALVRPDVPVGVDDLPLADGGREGPRHRRDLVGDEPRGAQRGRRPARGLPRDDEEGVGPGAGHHRRRPRARRRRGQAAVRRDGHPHPPGWREGLRRRRSAGAGGGRPARRPGRASPTSTEVRRAAARQPPARHRPGRPGRRHAGHRGRRRRVLRPGRHARAQGRGGRPALGRLRARRRRRPASTS